MSKVPMKFKVIRILENNDLQTDIGVVDVTTDAVHKIEDFEVGKTYECVLNPYLYISYGEIKELK